MQICSKLLILLLVIELVPLVFCAVINQIGRQRLGDRLTSDTRLLLEDSAQHLLFSKVADHRRILQLALDSQVWGVEQLLATPFPKSAPISLAAIHEPYKNQLIH